MYLKDSRAGPCYHGKLFCSSQRTILVFGRGDNGRLFLFVTTSVLHQEVAVQLLVEMNNICLALLHIVSPTTTILPLIVQCKGQVDALKPLSKKANSSRFAPMRLLNQD